MIALQLRMPLYTGKGTPWPLTNRQRIQRAIEFAAAELQIPLTDLRKHSNAASICVPRQQAMYLVRVLTSASLPEIGKLFGGFHHTTVLHALRKIEAARAQDLDLDEWIRETTLRFRTGTHAASGRSSNA